MDLCFLWQAVAELPLERLDEGGGADGKGGLFITSMHRIMPNILKKHGFNIDEYEETEEKKQGGLSAKEYKKKMEQEKEELNKKLEDMVKEYNELVKQ